MNQLHQEYLYDKICVFYTSAHKYLKGRNAKESLTHCVELRADKRIRSVATKEMNTRMLALLNRDLVAAEGHYHKSCYKLYTKGEVPASSIACVEQSQCEYAVCEEAEK